MVRKSSVVLVPGVVVEKVGNGVFVLRPGQAEVLRLHGHAADVVARISSGEAVDWSSPGVSDLSDAGIVTAPGLSRRNLMRAGAVAAGAGIGVLALPHAAVAASAEPVALTGTWRWWDDAGDFREFYYTWPAGTGPTGNLNDPEPTALTVGSGVGVTVRVDTENGTTTWSTAGTTGRTAPLSGPLIGEFSFDGRDYTVTFSDVTPLV